MTAPDAETYLRCRLEDALLGGAESGREEFGHRVRAAAAVGAVAVERAEQLLADADRAFGMRVGFDVDEDADDDDSGGGDEPRTVVCPTVIEQEWGTLVLSHLVLGAQETTVGVSGMLAGASAGRRGRRWHDLPWEAVDIVDAAGTKYQAHFSGGSSDTGFDGEYTLHPGLDRAATEVTVAGHRIDLADPPAPRPVRVDPLSALSPIDRARRHLELLSDRWRNDEEVEAARDTFAGLGVGPLGDDEDDARPGLYRGSYSGGPRSGGHRRSGGRRRDRTARRWLAVGATTPPVDGVVVTLTTLSDDGRVSLLGTVSGRLNRGMHDPELRLSAVDDVGTRYTGEHESSTGGDGSFQTTRRLDPELAPQATVLTLVVDTLCHQVLVDVPLDWPDR